MTILQQRAYQAGLFMTASIFVIRMATSRSLPDIILTVGLTGAELSVVLLAEGQAKRYEAALQAWRQEDQKLDRAEREVEAALMELERREARIDLVRAAITDVEAEMERDHSRSDLKALTIVATNAIRSGYAAAIAANRAMRRGLANPGEMVQ